MQIIHFWAASTLNVNHLIARFSENWGESHVILWIYSYCKIVAMHFKNKLHYKSYFLYIVWLIGQHVMAMLKFLYIWAAWKSDHKNLLPAWKSDHKNMTTKNIVP